MCRTRVFYKECVGDQKTIRLAEILVIGIKITEGYQKLDRTLLIDICDMLEPQRVEGFPRLFLDRFFIYLRDDKKEDYHTNYPRNDRKYESDCFKHRVAAADIFTCYTDQAKNQAE